MNVQNSRVPAHKTLAINCSFSGDIMTTLQLKLDCLHFSTHCHSHCQHVHKEVTECETIKLCHVFRSAPDLQIHVQYLEVPFHSNVGPNSCSLSGSFTIALPIKCEYLRIEMCLCRRQIEKGFFSVRPILMSDIRYGISAVI